MSDNWNPPPGRNPNEPEPEADQPTDEPAPGPARRGGQSPLWWTESTEKQKEYLQPAPPGEKTPLVPPPHQPNLTWNLPPYSQPTTPARPTQGGPTQSGPGGGPAQAGPAQGGPAQSEPGQGGPAGPASGGRRVARHAGPPPSGRAPASGATAGGGVSAPTGGASWSASGGQGGVPGGVPAGGWVAGGGQGAAGGGGQPPTWQYPPIPIPQPPGPGRRRKPRRTPKALLIGLVVLAVLVVGTGVTLLVRGGGDDKVPASVESPTTAPSETPSATPSATPSVTPSTPAPPTVDEIVTTSRLYTVGALSPTQCLEPKAIPTTYAGAKAYYGLILPCMNRTWWLAMKKASLPYRAPKLVLFAGPLTTVCGRERGTRAFYCGKNETIYIPHTLGVAYYTRNPVSGRVWMMTTLAHEYGHHVQKLSGIYAASLARQVDAATPADKLVESRRRELQASCFGSAYLGAAGPYIPLRGPLLDTWKVLVANTGDDAIRPRTYDRGNRVNNTYWSFRGFNTKSPNVCNTFVAKPAQTG